MNKETYFEKESFEEKIVKEINNMLKQKELSLEPIKNGEDLLQLVDFFRKEINYILDLQKDYPNGKSEILENLILIRDKIRVGSFKTGRFEWYLKAFDKIKNKEERWEKLEEMMKKALEEDQITVERVKPETLGQYYKNLLNKVLELQK